MARPMMQRRLKGDQLLRAIATVADDGFCTAAELHPALPRVSRRDLERGLARAANRGHVVLRRTPEGRRFVALSGEGWQALGEGGSVGRVSDPNGSPVTGSDRYAHRFGSTPPLSLGVEEELLLVDPETHRLVPSSELVLDSVSGAAAERISAEIFTEQIEIKTGVCLGADDALAELREGRATVAATGVGLLGSGLHPTEEGDAQLVAEPRYEVVRADLGDILNTPPCGLHVHVGMPEPETAVRIANAFRLYLPVLAALSANSPFRGGADSGHASARTTVVRAYPRFQVPRHFRDYEDFCRVADQLIAAAGVDDYTYIWWDVRPHPKLGTVEVRAVDVQADAATSTALAALIQAIAAKELEDPTELVVEREALEESYFQAASHGLDARIMLSEAQPRPAREVARDVLDAALPYARELGAADALEEIERILREGNGAEEQRRVQAEGGTDVLLAHLATRTR